MRTRLTCLGLTLAILSGCGQDPPAHNTVQGQVTLGGKPLRTGIVALHGPTGSSATGAIRPDGSYTIDDPPLGLCRITVHNPPQANPPSGKGPRHGGPDPSPLIPAAYAREGNGLSVEIKPGQQKKDIDLK